MSKSYTIQKSSPPPMTLNKVRTSWVVINGQACALASCSKIQFMQMVWASAPAGVKDIEARALLNEDTLDDVARWFIVCALLKEKAKIQLYGSQHEAEKALARVR